MSCPASPLVRSSGRTEGADPDVPVLLQPSRLPGLPGPVGHRDPDLAGRLPCALSGNGLAVRTPRGQVGGAAWQTQTRSSSAAPRDGTVFSAPGSGLAEVPIGGLRHRYILTSATRARD